MLNGGTWDDGRKRSQELLQNQRGSVHSDWRQGLRLLREECLSQFKDHSNRNNAACRKPYSRSTRIPGDRETRLARR